MGIYRKLNYSKFAFYMYVYDIYNGEDIKMYYARMGEIGYTCLQLLLYIDIYRFEQFSRFDRANFPFFVA